MKELHDYVDKARKFLRSARILFYCGDCDSCVSHCYYAMFFMAEAVLFSKGMSASSRRGVITLFGEHFVKPSIFDRSLARSLSNVYDYR